MLEDDFKLVIECTLKFTLKALKVTCYLFPNKLISIDPDRRKGEGGGVGIDHQVVGGGGGGGSVVAADALRRRRLQRRRLQRRRRRRRRRRPWQRGLRGLGHLDLEAIQDAQNGLEPRPETAAAAAASEWESSEGCEDKQRKAK